MNEQLESLIRQMTEIISDAYDKGYKDGRKSVQRKEQTEIKVGDKVRTLKDRDCHNIKLFPLGTIGEVTEIDNDCVNPYKVEANNDYWWYSRDMLEVVDVEIKERE